MQILTTPQQLAAQCRAWHKAGDDIALVPTMGYYHAGHEALMAQGRTLGKRLVVSLFVNPTQFGPDEDLDAYPRDAERDAAIAASHGADVLFMPEPGSMYAPDHATWVEVPDLAKGLCGQTRPIHFRGVCTVVLKLFMLSAADVAVFGQKDWQQQAILRRMVRDLNLPVRIETLPIVRESDGLALSSRNAYLSTDQRAAATAFPRALNAAARAIAGGSDVAGALAKAEAAIVAGGFDSVDYVALADADSLERLGDFRAPARLLAAARIGKTRLIDNYPVG